MGAPGKPAEQGQRRDARRSHAASGRRAERKEKVAGKSSTGVMTLAEAQKLEKPSKAWDAVPA